MADILSQAEIDALLSAMSSGELDTDQMQQKNEKRLRFMISAVRPSSRKSI